MLKTIAMTDAATGQQVGTLKLNESLNIGETFRLIGNTTVFKAVALPLVAGFIPAVEGISLDGKYRTRARIADTAGA